MALYATTFPEQPLETIRLLGRTMQCQVAHDVWTHRDAGVPPADAGSNCPCARSAARICRETFDQNDHTCLPRFHAGRERVTWPPRRVGTRATPTAGRSDRPKLLRAIPSCALMKADPKTSRVVDRTDGGGIGGMDLKPLYSRPKHRRSQGLNRLPVGKAGKHAGSSASPIF